MILRWYWWHLHSHYWANPFWICFKSNGHSTEWILTGLVPIRISVLISLWITPILTLRHRIVQKMMEDQVMILICMVMKGMWNGYLAILWHPFPISLFYCYISWIIVLTRPTSLLHAIPCHPFSNPPPIPSSSPTVSVSMPEFRYLLPYVPTIFRINRERAVGPSLFSSPLEWWGRSPAWEVSVRSSPTTLSVDQCTILMRLPETFWENETHRLRDSTLHTPPLTCGLIGNGLSGTLFVWNGEGVGGCLTECSVVHEHQGDSLGRKETGDGD